MKTSKQSLFIMSVMLALILATVVGCDKFYRYDCRSYIQEYSKVEGIVAEVELESITVSIVRGHSVSMFSTGNDKLLYDNLCAQNNDLGYNEEYWFMEDKKPEIICIYPDLVDIEIVSNADFDASHPAGTSLKECVEFSGTLYKKFIDNCYPSYEPAKTTAPLNELQEDDLQLLSVGFRLTFNREPEQNKAHRFTITVTDKEGKSYSTKLEYLFD